MDNGNLTKKERHELKRQEKLARKENEAKNFKKQRIIVWSVTVVVILGTLFGLVKLSSNRQTLPQAPVTNNDQPTAPIPPVVQGENVIGNLTASTTLVEYSDFQCPACAAVEPMMKDLMSQFQSQVKFVYRYFPLPSHSFGQLSAEMAEAAARQGKFWEMHDKLFETQRDWSNSGDARQIFLGYAQGLGLNMAQFNNDLNSPELKAKIAAEAAGGAAAGVNSTPSFFVNGQKIELQNYDDLRVALQNALAK